MESQQLKETLHEIIFEADTPAGKTFDVILLFLILFSILVVMLESVSSIRESYGKILYYIEWVLTILFSIEYLVRLYIVNRPVKYAFSFFGIIDFLSIVPTYISFFVPGSQSLIVIRSLRLLRTFRVLKLGRYVGEAAVLMDALRDSREKITVFIVGVLSAVVIVGAAMYLIEGAASGFTSIPMSIYWAIVTMTTVGYGDIAPQTVPGQVLASIVMILGYGIIAVPTGIFSMAIVGSQRKLNTRSCQSCTREGHARDAVYCDGCGEKLNH